MSSCVPGDLSYVSTAKTTTLIINFPGTRKCVEHEPSLVLNAKDSLAWRISQCIRVDATAEIKKEDNNETKYPKIHTFQDNASKPKEWIDNDKTAQTIPIACESIQLNTECGNKTNKNKAQQRHRPWNDKAFIGSHSNIDKISNETKVAKDSIKK